MIGSLVMLISITLMYSTPFVFGGMAGVISERSGVTNIGIEGMMTIGAFAGVAGSFLSGNPWVGLLTAGVAGGLVATLHAIASVLLVGDQTVSGVAINLFAPGFALFGCRMLLMVRPCLRLFPSFRSLSAPALFQDHWEILISM